LKKFIAISILLLCVSFGYAQVASLEENIAFLSSDGQRGRENGTIEAKLSADYIATQFEMIGLSAPDFTDHYLQKITLISAKSSYKKLVLNEEVIATDNFFTLGQFEKLSITSISDFQSFYIGENDDFSIAFMEINKLNSSYAVFIHPVHHKRFERLKRYFTAENLALENVNKSFSLWVLSDIEVLNSIQLISRNEITRTEIYNVIGAIEAQGGDDRKWIFSAHYDHIGIQYPAMGDSIANGANDDASGVAAVLELAKKFKTGTAPSKTLYFVAFAGEELGLFGSNYLAQQLNLDSIEAMLNFEMIGKANEDLGPQSAYLSGYELSYLPGDMARNVEGNDFMIFPDPYPNLNLFNRGDNAPFAAYGIPAHSISTYSDNDPDYHKVSDELETLDLEHMEQVINEVYKAVLPLLDLNYSPGIIDFKTKTIR